jgi:hypothetical protein
MADDVFRQNRKKVTADDLGETTDNPLDTIRSVQEAVAKETGVEAPKNFGDAPFQISGNIPAAFKDAISINKFQNSQGDNVPKTPVNRKPMGNPVDEDDGFSGFDVPPERPRPQQSAKPTPDAKIRVQGSDALEGLLAQLAEQHTWEEFEFPSKGKFYSNIPATVHVRAMTGGEEQILATPRWVKKGKAIDMIFRRCIKEQINTEDLLSSDRTNLLIYLRGISYTPEYDVEIKCPNCSIKFAHVIDLNDMDVEVCPDNFGPDQLSGVLPTSKFRYRYRLATGQDEQEINSYREKRIQQWGDQGDDDTLLYRTALLLEEIEGVTLKKELAQLLAKLPIQDVSYLRNEINTPPFGVDTELPILCPSCTEEFKIDLPLETSFFFPRKKASENQA